MFGVDTYSESASGLLQPVMVGDSLQDTGMSGQRQLVGSSPGHIHSFTDFTCSTVMTWAAESGFIKSVPVGDFAFHRNTHIITRSLFHSDRTEKTLS